MALDPSIYNNVGRVNVGAGLSDILDQQRQREMQRTQQEQTLASLAKQKELGGFQLRDLQRKESAIPGQQAHARSQELNMWLSNEQRLGRPIEDVMPEAIAKGQEIGVDPEVTKRHVAGVYGAGDTPKSRSDFAFTQAYPELVAKQRAEAMYRKPEEEKQVNWSTLQTDKGIVQVHPRTGQIRPLGVQAPAKPTTSGGGAKLSPTAQKELFEADDTAQSSRNVQSILQSALELNNKTYSGYGAKARAVARSNLPGVSEEADNTIQLDNMMTGQALESLKATFGGMPTEGERKILLEMQASADKTPEQRKDIMQRAISAAKKREQFSIDRAKALRAGTYFSDQPADTNAGEDQSWSDL